MPQSLIGLKQIKSGEIGSYITGALGVSSTGSTVYTSKPSVFNSSLTVSGAADLKDTSYAREDFQIASGLLVSGNITGLGNLNVTGTARFDGDASFDNPVILEDAFTVSGAAGFSGVSRFDAAATFNSSATFNDPVSLTDNFTVSAAGTTTLNGPFSSLGNATIGTNAGGSTTTYLVGNNIFSGNCNFSGINYFSNINRFSGNTIFNSGVTFNSGNIVFSGTGQGFATKTTFSGDVSLLGNTTGVSLQITSSVGISTSATFNNSGQSFFYNDVYISGVGNDLILRGNSTLQLSDSDVSQLSGVSDYNESYINLNSGSFLEIKSGSKETLYKDSNFMVKSGAKFTIETGIYTQSDGSIPTSTAVPTGQLYVQQLTVNGVTYHVLAIRKWIA